MPDPVDPSESQKESNAEPPPNGAAEESSKKGRSGPLCSSDPRGTRPVETLDLRRPLLVFGLRRQSRDQLR